MVERSAAEGSATVVAPRVVGIGNRRVVIDIRVHVVGIPDVSASSFVNVLSLSVGLLRISLQPLGLDLHLLCLGLLPGSLRLTGTGIQRRLFTFLAQVGCIFSTLLFLHLPLTVPADGGNDSNDDQDYNNQHNPSDGTHLLSPS